MTTTNLIGAWSSLFNALLEQRNETFPITRTLKQSTKIILECTVVWKLI